MTAPTPYSLAYDFTAFQAANPSTPLPADKIEVEFNALAQTTDELIANLGLIQRSDGALATGSVTYDALSTTVQALLGSSLDPQGAWVTATEYAVMDMVDQGGSTYVCAVAHTSGTFATDFAANKWLLFAGSSGVTVNDSNWSGTDLSIANGGTGASNASDARTALGLVIGTNVQAYSAELAAIAALTGEIFGRSLLTLADAEELRTATDFAATANTWTALNTFSLDIRIANSKFLRGETTTPGTYADIIGLSSGNNTILRTLVNGQFTFQDTAGTTFARLYTSTTNAGALFQGAGGTSLSLISTDITSGISKARVYFYSSSDAGTSRQMASIAMDVSSATNAAETANLVVRTRQSGTLNTRLIVSDDVQLGDGSTAPGNIFSWEGTIADDAAATIDVPFSVGVVIISGKAGVAANRSGVLGVKVDGGTPLVSLAVGAGLTVDATSGTLTGTTGSDGNLTVRASTTTGNLYIENRLGGSGSFTATFVGAVG